ncbi:hypothetical protein Dimus_002626 [Dionaea muscipula]
MGREEVEELLVEMALVGLLRVIWAAGVLPLLIASIPSSRVLALNQTLQSFCGRGKTTHPSSLWNFTVPQRFFSHFYVVGVIWTTTLIVTTWSYAHEMAALASESTLSSSISAVHKPRSISAEHPHIIWRSVFVLLLMEIQVLRRLYESTIVFIYSSSARMHIFAYLTGIWFYTAAPLSLCCNFAPEAFTFAANRVAGLVKEGRNQTSDWWEYIYPPLMELSWSQWIGAVVFLWGSIHQWRCHTILGKLRRVKEHGDDYVIPHGDWFDIVSCPHYLAEIVLYAGILVASGGMDLTVWLLFAFVVANLTFAAAETQRWYHRKFDNYPSNRYAIIPYFY